MPRVKSQAALVARLCRTLSDIQTASGDAPFVESAMHVGDALEGLIFERLDEDVLSKNGTRAALVATGAPRLVQAAINAGRGPITLTPQGWKLLLQTITPDELCPLLGSGISRSGLPIPLIGRAAAGDHTFSPLLIEVAGSPELRDHTILTKNYRGLLTNAASAGITAEFLRLQVACHPASYKDLAKNFLSKSDLFLVAILNLAGVSFEKIQQGIYRPSPLAQRFLDSLSSAHGRMAYLERCQSLEHLLTQHEAFEDWRQEMARQANIALRPL